MSQLFQDLFDITSANATSVLVVDTLFPVGIVLEQYATDSALTMESLDVTENRQGVDGVLVGGYIPSIKTITINLEATSPSFMALSIMQQAMDALKRKFNCTLISTVPSIRKVFTFSNGWLKSGTIFPSQEKVLAPTAWVFNFGKLNVVGL